MFKKQKISVSNAKSNKKYSYTPQSVVRGLESKMKLEYEFKLSEVTENLENRINDLSNSLSEAIQTIQTQQSELEQFNNKIHTSMAHKFVNK